MTDSPDPEPRCRWCGDLCDCGAWPHEPHCTGCSVCEDWYAREHGVAAQPQDALPATAREGQ